MTCSKIIITVLVLLVVRRHSGTEGCYVVPQGSVFKLGLQCGQLVWTVLHISLSFAFRFLKWLDPLLCLAPCGVHVIGRHSVRVVFALWVFPWQDQSEYRRWLCLKCSSSALRDQTKADAASQIALETIIRLVLIWTLLPSTCDVTELIKAQAMCFIRSFCWANFIIPSVRSGQLFLSRESHTFHCSVPSSHVTQPCTDRKPYWWVRAGL